MLKVSICRKMLLIGGNDTFEFVLDAPDSCRWTFLSSSSPDIWNCALSCCLPLIIVFVLNLLSLLQASCATGGFSRKIPMPISLAVISSYVAEVRDVELLEMDIVLEISMSPAFTAGVIFRRGPKAVGGLERFFGGCEV